MTMAKAVFCPGNTRQLERSVMII